jgi:hypothetical protein
MWGGLRPPTSPQPLYTANHIVVGKGHASSPLPRRRVAVVLTRPGRSDGRGRRKPRPSEDSGRATQRAEIGRLIQARTGLARMCSTTSQSSENSIPNNSPPLSQRFHTLTPTRAYAARGPQTAPNRTRTPTAPAQANFSLSCRLLSNNRSRHLKAFPPARLCQITNRVVSAVPARMSSHVNRVDGIADTTR